MIKYTTRQRMFRKFWFFKLCYGRGHSYLSTFIDIIQFYIMATLWFKLYLKVTNDLLLNIGFLLFFLILWLLGFIDVKKHIINEENSFTNQFNPEIKHLIKHSKGKVKHEMEVKL